MTKNTSVKNSKSKAVDSKVSAGEKRKHFTFDLPLALHTKLKINAARKGKTMGEIVCSILEEHLK